MLFLRRLLFPRIATAEPRARTPPTEPSAMSETLNSTQFGNIEESFLLSGSVMGQSPAPGAPPVRASSPPSFGGVRADLDNRFSSQAGDEWTTPDNNRGVYAELLGAEAGPGPGRGSTLPGKKASRKVPVAAADTAGVGRSRSVESIVSKVGAPLVLMTRRDAILAKEDETLAKSDKQRFVRCSSKSKFERKLRNRIADEENEVLLDPL